MVAGIEKENSIFFNHSFDKKRLKALISWVFKKFGEAEALRVLDLLKETGFRHATKAGISIGVQDLTTPIQKSWLISESQLAMNITDRDFIGAKITATERSQRIIDTWHRASESLSKQVVDYFSIYDQFNPVYIMALSGARGNFSQVRQLIGMRGLMADQQGKIVNFPILSNLREGLTLTEYFISCSGARKGLVDTALRTADTGYLTRRLVDVSHNVVVKRIRCNTNRGIAFKSLQSYNKVLLALKERLVGRVLAEDIEITLSTSLSTKNLEANLFRGAKQKKSLSGVKVRKTAKLEASLLQKKNETSIKSTGLYENQSKEVIGKKDQEISPKLSLKIARVRDQVFIRSPLTCGFTNEVCQLCYGWSISQGSLVSLGDAVGVIAAQSIGEPGTQLTMRTFHTGGVFSGDLLQEIRAPHPGTIQFSKAFQGLLIRTAHGRIAFLSKTKGSLILSKDNYFTEMPIQAFTMLFVKQGEEVKSNQLLAEYSIQSKEGNQPIKTQQTIFAELSGRVIEDRSGTIYTKPIKESLLLLDPLQDSFSTPFLEETKLLSSAMTCPKGGKKSKELPLFACHRVAPLGQGAQRGTKIAFLEGGTKRSLSSIKQGKKSTSAFALRYFSLRSKAKAGFAQQKTNRVTPYFARRVLPQIVLRSKTKKSFSFIKEGEGGGKRGIEKHKGVQLRSFACNGSKGIPFGGSKTRRVRARQDKASMEERAQTSKFLIYNEYPPNSFLKSKASTSRNTSLKVFPFTFFLRSRALELLSPQVLLRKTWFASQTRSVASRKLCFLGTVAQPLRGKKVDFRKLKKFRKENVVLLSKKRKKESDVHTELRATNEIGKNTKMDSRACVGNQIYKPQILSSLKNEDLENDVFKYVEPVKSGRLGFLKILSTRVGATLDYMCPIKPFDYYLIKKKRRERAPFQRGNSFPFFRFSNPVLASPARFSEARPYTAVVEERTSYGKVHLEGLKKPQVAGFRYACRALTPLKGLGTERGQVKSFAFSKENYLKDNMPQQNKEIRLKKAVKYLHPEHIKENRFFLQTIAEYGDIVEEEYKTKII